MKKTNRLNRFLAMLLALTMIVSSQGMTSMAAIIGGVTGGTKQTEAPQTETEEVAQTEIVQEIGNTGEAELESESESEDLTPAETEAETELAAETEATVEEETEISAIVETEIDEIIEEPIETEIASKDEIEAELKTTYVWEDDEKVVTATLSEPGIIPAGAVFVVKDVMLSKADKALVEEAIGEDYLLTDYIVYDMYFEADGVKIEPENGTVSVSISYNKAIKPISAIEDMEGTDLYNDLNDIDKEYQVIHLEENGTKKDAVDVTDDVSATGNGKVDEVEFTTNSFTYMVVAAKVPVGNLTATNSFEDYADYTLENLLNGYQMLVFGNVHLKKHFIGAALIEGELTGEGDAPGFADNVDNAEPLPPSVVKGKVYNSEGLLVFSQRNKSDNVLYVGTANTATKLGDTYYLNGYALPSMARVFQNENFFDFGKAKQIVNSTAASMKNYSSEIIDYGYNNSVDIQAGSNVILRGVKTGTDENSAGGWQGLNIVGDLADVGNTIINIEGEGPFVLPMVTVNGQQLGGSMTDRERAKGSSVVWNLPDAKNVVIRSHPFLGHLIAPNAFVKMDSGDYNGTLVCASLETAAEGHLWPYIGGGLIPTNGDFKVTKTIDGDTPDAKFTFKLHRISAPEGATKFTDITQENDGRTVNFGKVTYSVEGEYYYIISEDRNDSDTSIEYDERNYLVKVVVTSTEDGGNKVFSHTTTYYEIVADDVLDADTVEVKNAKSYKVKTVSAVSFDNKKVVRKGRLYIDKGVTINGVVTSSSLMDGTYTFEILDAEKNSLSPKTEVTVNVVNGIGTSSPEYVELEAGTYYVREILTAEQTAAGISLLGDNDVAVTVTAGGTEKVDTNTASFTNNKNVAISVQFKGTKALTGGKALEDNMFEFCIVGTDGTNTTVKNQGNEITFPAIEYTKPGTYTYTITEVNGGKTIDGITYDSDTYEVTVTVSQGSDGTLSVAVLGATKVGDTDVYTLDTHMIEVAEGGTSTAKAATFVNEYHASGTGEVSGTKTLNGRKLNAGEFTFQVKNAAGQVVGSATNGADGSFKITGIGKELGADNKVLPFTEEDVDKKFHFTLTEVAGSLPGVDYSTASYALTVTVSDNGDGTLTVTVKPEVDKVEFINTYNTQETTGVELTKKLVGKKLNEGEFTFVLERKNEAGGWDKVAETGNGADGKVDFANAVTIELSDLAKTAADGSVSYPAKTFEYQVREVKPGNASENMDYSEAVYSFTVKAEYNYDTGVLSLTKTATGEKTFTFTNTWTSNASVQLSGTKTLDGRDLQNDEFTFELYAATKDEDGVLTKTGSALQSVQNTGSGFAFEPLTYTLDDIKVMQGEEATYPKTTNFYYVVIEKQEGKSGIEYDKTVKQVTVTVTYDESDGSITAKLADGSDSLIFTNTYDTSATASVEGTKTLTGRVPNEKDTFTFAIYAADAVEEKDGKVTAKGDALAEVTNHGGDFKFENFVEYTLQKDMKLSQGQYKTSETYHYVVLEKAGSDKAITYDKKVVDVTVTVRYDKTTGVLSAEVTPGKEGVAFVNEYHASGTGEVSGTKTLNGRKLNAGEFTFQVKNEDGQVVGSATNGADGSFKITGIGKGLDADGEVLPFTEEDVNREFHFTLSEVKDSLTGVDYSTASYNLKVTVSDDGDGTLTVAVEPDVDKVEFINTYNTQATKGLDAAKTLVGRKLKADEFTFTLAGHGVAANKAEVKSGADGSVTFADDTITITLADMADAEENPAGSGIYEKTFAYTLTESGEVDNVVNDANPVRTLELKATYNKNTGKLTLDWLGSLAERTFTNTYDTKETTGVELTKKLVGLDLTAGVFTFKLEKQNADGTWSEVATAPNDADGKASFANAIVVKLNDLKVVAEDGTVSYPNKTFTYRVSEVKPANADEAMIYDGTLYTFTVEASYDYGIGVLALKNNAAAGGYTFTNTWTAKAGVPLNGHKTLKDLNLVAGKYTFDVYEAGQVTVAEDGTVTTTGAPVLSAKNEADGSVAFGSLAYDLDDMKKADGTYETSKRFEYKVLEAKGEEEGVTYDPSVKTVVVEVTYDASTGDLSAALVSGMTDDLTFENEYDTEAWIGPDAVKKMEGRDLTADDVYTFTLRGDDAASAKTIQKEEEQNKGAEVAFGDKAIKVTLDDLADVLATETANGIYTKQFHYTLSETGSREGVTNDPNPKKLTLNARYDKNKGELTLAWEEGSNNQTFINTYAAEGTGKVSGTKTLTGRELKAGEFTFEVKNEAGEVVGSATNGADGSFEVTGIGKELGADGKVLPFTEEDVNKEFHFTLREVKGSLTGVDYSTTSYDLTVTVSDNGDGTLTVTVKPDDDKVEFINTYDTHATKGLDAAKKLVGRELKADEFTFTLAGQGIAGGEAEVKNGADGSVAFADGTITITLADMADAKETSEGSGVYEKTFAYTLTESGNKPGVSNDEVPARELTLKATYNKNTGKLTLEWLGSLAERTFTNTYDTKETTGVELTKKLVGLDLMAGAFTFKLEKQNADSTWTQVGSTVPNDADGKASFADAIVITLNDLKVTAADGTVSYPDKTFTYRVSEVKPADAEEAMIYDETAYTFTVDASYNFESGVLTLKNNAAAGGYTFTNSWTAKGSVPLNGHKTLKNRKLEAGKYTFEVYAAEQVTVAEDGTVTTTGAPVLSAKNAADGSVTFGSLAYDLNSIRRADGSYPETTKFEYKVLEVKGNEEGVTYDPSVKTIVVEVTYDMATGSLSAALVKDETDDLLFVNEYDTEARIGLNAVKEIEGRALTADDVFTFTLTADEGTDPETIQNATAKNDADGMVSLADAVKVTLDDLADVLAIESENGIYTKEFRYTLTETGSRPGVTNDPVPKKLTLNAIYDKNTGELTLAWADGSDNQTFINTYDATGKLSLEAVKAMKNPATELATFDFVVKDAEGSEVAAAQNDADGKISFTDIVTYGLADAGKTFTYTVSEVIPDERGIYLYDDTVYTVSVEVTDNGDGTLEAAVTSIKTADGAEHAAEGAEFVMTFTNDVTVVKLDKVDEDGNKVVGAKLQIKDAEGTVVDEWTTTEEIHELTGVLEAGKTYTLEEAETPVSYGTAEAIEFTVTEEGRILAGGEEVTLVTMTDKHIRFNVNKTELGDNSKEVEGAQLEVLDKDGNVVDSWTSKKGETHDFGWALKAGESYTLREKVAPNGYGYVSDIEFTVEKDGTVTTEMSTTADEDGNITFLVEDAPVHFHVDKVELGSGEELDGAKLTVYEVTTGADGSRVEKKVESWTSKKGENHDFGGKLKAGGNYVLREEVAPYGYAYTSDIEFSVDKEGTVTAQMPTTTDAAGNTVYLVEDAKVFGSVTLRKSSAKNKVRLAGAEFQLYCKNGDDWTLYSPETYKTGADGTLTVEKLPVNNYSFIETKAPAGYVIETDEAGQPKRYPFTISVSGTKTEVSVSLDVTNDTETKKEKTSLTVTKDIVFNDELWSAADETFYVALYADEALTECVSEVRPIVFSNMSSSSTEFEDLDYGTYYVAETTADGIPLNFIGGAVPTGEFFAIDFYDGNEVTIEKEDGTKEIRFRNMFNELPAGYYRDGYLTITKQLLGADGQETEGNETFYAGIFSDPEFTTLSKDVEQNIVALALDGTSTVSEVVKVSVPQGGSTTVYVTEVDESGVPVENAASFQYDVTVDGSVVTMDEQNLEATVVITNKEWEEEESEEVLESEGFEEGSDEGVVPETTKAVKTGDETPIALYIGLLLAAALVLIVVFLLRRRRRN